MENGVVCVDNARRKLLCVIGNCSEGRLIPMVLGRKKRWFGVVFELYNEGDGSLAETLMKREKPFGKKVWVL